MFYTSSTHLRLFLLFRYIPCKFKFSLCKPEELYCLLCCLRNLCCISCDFPLSYPANNGDLSHVKIILHDILTCEDSCFRANVHVLFLWHLYNILENKMWFENSANAWGKYWILYHKTNKEASTVFCSVVKHLGSGRALKKWGKTLDCVSCFPLHLFRALPLPACFTTEQNTVVASLFVKCRTFGENINKPRCEIFL